MKISTISIALACTMAAFYACKKKKEAALPPDVYVQGKNTGTNQIAYWVNGVQTLIPETYWGKMTVSNGSVYVPGTAGYYKNGEFIAVPDASQMRGIAINGEDVYIVATASGLNWKGYYWKNGTITMQDEDFSATIRDVAISDGDIYFSGYRDGSLGYWKNGVFTKTMKSASSFEGLVVSGGDVYVWGTDALQRPGYWKNEDFHQIISTNGTGAVYSIRDFTVDGTDVYAVTYASGNNDPLYWKNAQPVGIGTLNGAEPHSIAVKDGKVYVVGTQVADTIPGDNTALLWIDGKQQILAPHATASTIIVK